MKKLPVLKQEPLRKVDAVRALAALAHETRVDLFKLLVSAGPDGLSVGDAGKQLGIPPTTMAFHITQLANAGLVVQERVGKSVKLSVDFGEMNRLVEYLMENCCQGSRCP